MRAPAEKTRPPEGGISPLDRRIARVARHCGRIVLERGKVVQRGTHEELMADTAGRYSLLIGHE